MLGHRYHCEVRVFNQAGLYSEYSTDGVTIDYTDPIFNYVRINSPNQNLQLINGNVSKSVYYEWYYDDIIWLRHFRYLSSILGVLAPIHNQE